MKNDRNNLPDVDAGARSAGSPPNLGVGLGITFGAGLGLVRRDDLRRDDARDRLWGRPWQRGGRSIRYAAAARQQKDATAQMRLTRVDRAGLRPIAHSNRSPLAYVVLTYTLSIPFWAAGALTNLQILPALPVSALGLLCMVGAAAILVYRENGRAGVLALLQRSLDFERVSAKIWYLPIFLLMPGIMVVSYVVMRLIGVALPVPQFSFATVLILFVVFFIAAVGEELGWSGYAIDPLQDRYGALGGALLLGAVWALWHVIPLLEAQRSLSFIAWWSLGTLATRVIITWLYNNTGRSVFVAVLFHAMINVTWQLFPVNGSYYDPRVTSVITAAVAVAVVVVWGPRTLVRARYPRAAAATAEEARP